MIKVKSDVNKDAKVVVFHDAHINISKKILKINNIGALTVNTDVLQVQNSLLKSK